MKIFNDSFESRISNEKLINRVAKPVCIWKKKLPKKNEDTSSKLSLNIRVECLNNYNPIKYNGGYKIREIELILRYL